MKDDNFEKKMIDAYDSYTDDIFKFCYFKTRDHELSKDMMQQCFLKVWAYLKKGNDVDNIRALLYKIAGNLVIDWYRKKKSESLDDLSDQGFDPRDPSMETERYAETEWAMKALEKLDHEDRDLMILRYVEDLSPKEIAAMTDQKVNTVSVRINRITERLKKILRTKNE